MDVSPILDPLNEAQREAVTAPAGPVLVLAGAGSGKTRVLVHRIAWLVQTENISPHGVLAVTFTNKAAGEMRGRTEQLLGVPAGGMWVGTFHGITHRLLRMHWQETGLPQTFQILDSDDQYRIIRRILKAMNLDEAKWQPKKVQWFINARKDEGQRPKHIEHQDEPFARRQVDIYQAYQELCDRSGLVDFAELLLRCHELLLKHPDILAHYQQRFRHVLVDEFQDTNTIQYAWLRLLAGEHHNAFVVGDDDQSIYGWRGAKVENIQRFSEHFPGARVFRLEQNYRSTAAILNGANALIACNDGRMGKNLWTSGEQGELIQLYAAFNEQDEANFVVDRIRQWVSQGNNRDESAILYRSNAQSRVFEEKLIQANIPYRVYGGQRFFERAEIKDALAYLRLIANPHDEASFERVVNQPTRGIGGQTMALVREQAKTGGVSLHRAAELLVRGESLSARARNALMGFLNLLQELGQGLEGLHLGEQVEQVLAESGLWEHYSKEKGEKGISRRENLEELVNAARQYEWEDDGSGLDPLSIFLSHAALEAGEGQANAAQDCVQLMTLHSAKGLEFPLVFLCGMEEGLFPHKLSVAEPGRLEEERRLCYVGMTRARRHLILSWAEQRRLHGSENYCTASRFLHEIPDELIEEIRPTAKPSRAATAGIVVDNMVGAFQLGQRVRHNKFGSGVVLSYEGQGSHARVQVNFERAGAKWLVVAYADLQMV